MLPFLLDISTSPRVQGGLCWWCLWEFWSCFQEDTEFACVLTVQGTHKDHQVKLMALHMTIPEMGPGCESCIQDLGIAKIMVFPHLFILHSAALQSRLSF